jgi:hypothetical protein
MLLFLSQSSLQAQHVLSSASPPEPFVHTEKLKGKLEIHVPKSRSLAVMTLFMGVGL